MAELKPCNECGGPMVEVDLAGHVERPALVRENIGHFFSKDALVPLERAHACLSCGCTRLFVDPAKLNRRVPPPAPPPAPLTAKIEAPAKAAPARPE